MNYREACSGLVGMAAMLADQEYMPSDDPNDYGVNVMAIEDITEMMSRPRELHREIAKRIREYTDVMATEIHRLRACISQTPGNVGDNLTNGMEGRRIASIEWHKTGGNVLLVAGRGCDELILSTLGRGDSERLWVRQVTGGKEIAVHNMRYIQTIEWAK